MNNITAAFKWLIEEVIYLQNQPTLCLGMALWAAGGAINCYKKLK